MPAKRLSSTPTVYPTADVKDSSLGRGHEQLRAALPDFRARWVEGVLDIYEQQLPDLRAASGAL